jgi:tetratricopeptide (TPR) repeat protein
VRAVSKGEVIPLDALNAAFSDPRRIALAYQQASYVVEMLVEQHGEEALHRMLRAYADGMDDAAALAKALAADLPALQTAFDVHVEKHFGAMARALAMPDGVNTDELDVRALARLAEAHPGSFPLQMLAGQSLLDAGDAAAAVPLLLRAAKLVPAATGGDGPLALAARAALDAGDRRQAAEHFEQAVTADLTGLEEARELAALSAELDDTRRELVAHRRISELVPHEAASHSVIGRAAMKDGDFDVAALRFKLALAAGPADVAAARTDHAEVLVARGRSPEAKRELMAALEEAPLYGRAQDLLLAIVDTPRRDARPR